MKKSNKARWTPWMFVGSGVLVLGVAWFGGSEPLHIDRMVRSVGELMGNGSEQEPSIAYEEHEGSATPAEVMRGAWLELDSVVCVVGQRFAVTAHVPGDSLAWVGVVPASIPHGSEVLNDERHLSHVYLEDFKTRPLTLPCPSVPGEYDVRLHDEDDGGRELRSVRIEARFDPKYGVRDTILMLVSERRSYPEADTHAVVDVYVPESFSEDAWVGLVPAHAPHRPKILDEKYIRQRIPVRRGSMQRITFDVPYGYENYNIRLYESASTQSEIAFVYFMVDGPTLCR